MVVHASAEVLRLWAGEGLDEADHGAGRLGWLLQGGEGVWRQAELGRDGGADCGDDALAVLQERGEVRQVGMYERRERLQG